MMKKILSCLFATLLLFSLSACGNSTPQASQSNPRTTTPPAAPQESNKPEESPGNTSNTDTNNNGAVAPESSNILIAYFTWADNTVVENPAAVDVDATTSASVLVPGNTAKLAGWIQEETGGDLFSLVVEEPYSSDYDECLDRAADEKAKGDRPALTTHVDNMDDYDIVFLGYPNWWYTVPMAIYSFIEEYDLSGKTVIPFCAHGTSGLSSTVRDITAALPDDCTVLEAIGVYRPDVASAQEDITAWVRGLGIEYGDSGEEPDNTLYLHVSEKIFTATLADNSSADALKELLAEGSVTIDMSDYGGFEKVGSLGTSLPTNDEQITTEAGDLILYQGNAFVIYYAPNSWSFTRLGKIDDTTGLKEALGSGNVTVTLSLSDG